MPNPLIRAHELNSVKRDNLPGTYDDPLVCKSYVDNLSYTIYGPKVGQSHDDSRVPIYSDFTFSLGATRTASYDTVDNQTRQVMYFSATSTTNVVSWYRAHRYTNNQRYVFDNEPLSVPGLNPGERIIGILNVSTYYITALTSTNRTLIISTEASSVWREWVIAYDVTSLGSGTTNFGIIETDSGDRIVRLSYDTTGFTLDVYSNSLTLLRSQTLLTYTTDIDVTDYLGQGRTVSRVGMDDFKVYTTSGKADSFAWNKYHETFHVKTQAYKPYNNAAGGVVEFGVSLSIAWSIPLSWFESGTGTLTNLITPKQGGYRYHQLNDSTWDTDTGGMNTNVDGGFQTYGACSSLSVDEFSGQLLYNNRGTWDTSTVGQHFRINPSAMIKTIGTNILPVVDLSYNYGIPDGSYWSKMMYSQMIVGSTMMMTATSTRYGGRWVSTPFSTTSFSSVTAPNDTLKFDSTQAILDIDHGVGVPAIVAANFAIGLFGTTVSGSTPTRYWAMAGAAVHTETVLPDGSPVYTPTTLNLPALPATIGSVTLRANQKGTAYVWNGSTTTPRVWCVIYATDNLQYVILWTGGSWTLASTSPQSMLAINTGNSSRNDTQNWNEVRGSGLLTASGKYLFTVTVPVVGTSHEFFTIYDTTTNGTETRDCSNLLPTGVNNPGQYINFQSNSNMYRTFGYSTTFGYYHVVCNVEIYASAILSSRNVETGATITEQQWIDGSVARPQKFATVEAATGLVAYIVEYPIILGGYVVNTPEQPLGLAPNTVNYIYVSKDPSDTLTVDAWASTTLMPSSFSRILVAAVTTNATDVVSTVQYSYDGSGLPTYAGNTGKMLSNDGIQLVWQEAAGDFRTESSSTTLVAADTNGTVMMTGGTSVTVQNDNAIPIGAKISVITTAAVSLAQGSGVTIRWVGSGGGVSGNRSIAANSTIELRKITATMWYVYGNGIT